MRKSIFVLLALLGCSYTLFSQIKIGDSPESIDPSSVLELESTDRVLVITRINTEQMNAIVPASGALIYNTDEDCIFYYNGTEWLNLCASLGLSLTAEANVNDFPTIILTENGTDTNIEVGEIRGSNIVDFSISAADIQNNSITADKLAPSSVGVEELQDNAVTDAEIDYNQVTLTDFVNDAGYITLAEIVSAASGNDIIDNGGSFYDDSGLQSDIAANTAAIAADGDTDATNEIQDLNLAADILTITNNPLATPVDLSSYIDNPDGSETIINDSPTVTVTGTGTAGDPYLLTGSSGADGSETIVTGNATVNVSGTGTTADPYILDSPDTSDGSETIINDSPTVTVAGTGTAGDPYLLTGSGGADGSETIVTGNATVNVSGTGTTADPYILDSPGTSDGSETIINDSPTVTVAGTGTAGDPYLLTGSVGADGSETIVTGNATVNVSGTGTTADPYILDSPDTSDGSETIINDSPTVTIAGTGTAGDPYLLTSSGGADGSETIVTGNATVNVSGTGTTADPYILDSPDTSDGSETIINDSPTVTIAGTGTAGDPYLLTSSGGADGSETIVTGNATVNVSGTGTTADPYILDSPDTSDGSETIINDSPTVTVAGAGTAGDPYLLTSSGGHTGNPGSIFFADDPSGIPTENNNQLYWDNADLKLYIGNQISTTTDVKLNVNGTTRTQGIKNSDGTIGSPSYRFTNDLNSGMYSPATNELGFTAGSTEAMRITNPGNTRVTITDEFKLNQELLDINNFPGTAGQILSSTGTGVDWIDAPSGGSVLADNITIEGDGTVGNELQVVDGGIDTQQIANNAVESGNIATAAVTNIKIAPSAINGQVLTTNSGAVTWADPIDTSPLVGIGKINSGGGAAKITAGLGNSTRTGPGAYTVNLNGGFVTSSNYIINVSVEGDFRIYISNQTLTSFSVEIKDSAGTLSDAIWHFTLYN